MQTKTIMSPVIDNSRGWNHFKADLVRAKDDLEHLREQLIRHCTMTSATLIGLIAAFVNIPSQDTVLRYLIVCSVVLLFLSVVVGVLYSFLYISSSQKSLLNCARRYKEGGLMYTRSPFLEMLARVFPWLMCGGILSLSLSVLLLLL